MRSNHKKQAKKGAPGMRLTVLDLFCGLGGLSLGFDFTEAFETIGGIDNFHWAVQTFYANHSCKPRLLCQPHDLSQLDPAVVVDELGAKPDVIVGGPPCQGFSDAGRRLSDLGEDRRNHLVFHFFRFVRDIRPEAFLMENVSGFLRTGQSRAHELIDLLVTEYQKIGYSVAWQVLNSSGFRVPQNRKRFLLVGLLNRKKPFAFPAPVSAEDGQLLFEPALTVWDALSDLPTPCEADPQPYESLPKSNLQRYLRLGSDGIYNHLETLHSDQMVSRLMEQKVGTRLYSNWNHSWYRLDPSRPSPAVKENHRAPFVHFSEPRAVSPRECARLQTVPDRYRLLGTKTAQLIMVGNGVPAIFAAHIATELARQGFGVEPPVPWDAETNPLLSA
jgi:DNA (cytosine-5)-methyltransferase 1